MENKRIGVEASTDIHDLPISIMEDILLRQPIQAILYCRHVCKSWQNIVSDPYFSRMCDARLPLATIFLTITRDNIVSLWNLGEGMSLCNLGEGMSMIVKKRELALPIPTKGQLHIVGTCNGLVCLWNKFFDTSDDLYIWNPVLGQCILLPSPKREKRIAKSAYGYGFSQSTGQYKVLTIVYKSYLSRPNKSEGEIITLGIDNTWRNIGSVPFPLNDRICKVVLNGALHWLVEDYEKTDFIYSFDIGKEKLEPIVPPPGLVNQGPLISLVPSPNFLCILDHSRDSEFEIWLMKDYGVADSWVKYHRVETLQVEHGSLRFPVNVWMGEEEHIIEARDFIFSSSQNEQRSSGQLELFDGKLQCSRTATYRSVAAYKPSLLSRKDVIGGNSTPMAQ